MISFTYDWDWAEADQRFERSIESNPNLSTTQHLYSHFLVAMGRFEESHAVSQRALRLNPLDVEMNVHLGWHHQMAREYNRALAEAENAVTVDPDFHEAYWILGLAQLSLGRLDDALPTLEKAAESSGRVPFIVGTPGHAYGLAGMRGEAEAVLAELGKSSQQSYVSEYILALVHTGMDGTDEAFAALEGAFNARDNWMAYLATEPRFDPIRPDPRFSKLLRRMGLSERLPSLGPPTPSSNA